MKCMIFFLMKRTHSDEWEVTRLEAICCKKRDYGNICIALCGFKRTYGECAILLWQRQISGFRCPALKRKRFTVTKKHSFLQYVIGFNF